MTANPGEDAQRGGPPAISTPPRRAGSIRRTTTHDAVRPDGLSGPVVVRAHGRDLITTVGGDPIVLDTAQLEVTVRHSDGAIVSIRANPTHPGLVKLVGACASMGFRNAIRQALPGESQSHSVRFQLLDELPAVVLASGRALRAAGIGIDMRGAKLPVDICAGWAAGGTLLTGMTDLGPPLHVGPHAPAIEPQDDSLAWHVSPSLPPHSTRRRRRLDLWEEGGRAWADCFFRDSHTDADGLETVVHEWSVWAELDPARQCFVSGSARMGPLPYAECPSAAASASRLAGAPFDGLRQTVRASFVGPSTCTHLNDTFRSMEDVGALLERLRSLVGD